MKNEFVRINLRITRNVTPELYEDLMKTGVSGRGERLRYLAMTGLATFAKPAAITTASHPAATPAVTSQTLPPAKPAANTHAHGIKAADFAHIFKKGT